MSFKNEKIVETKSCQKCQTSFSITDKDLEFYDKVSPVFAGEKYSIPTPKLCPECRQQRRLSWRNERSLYRRKCDATGKDIIATFNSDSECIVYSQEFWWSDNWNPLDYGQDFDFSRSFSDQFWELLLRVPMLAIINKNSHNCEHTHISQSNKNCYLIIESSDNEESMYSYWIQKSKYAIDSAYCTNSEHVYESINLRNYQYRTIGS